MFMSSPTQKEFFRGMRSIIPILIGVFPFAVVLGFAMKNARFSLPEGTFFALSMFGGTAQLASVQLYVENSPALIIIATAIIINLRYSMYSLSLNTILGDRSFAERLFAAFIVSDQSYAFSIAEAERNPGNAFMPAFFFGASIMLYLMWVGGIFLGFNIGAFIPPQLHLDFAIPLVFMSLLIPHLGGRDRAFSAFAGAVAAVMLVHTLPLQSGLLAAILIGITAGIIAGKSMTKYLEDNHQ
jgi:predicted branched-subunit amino acid permease